MSITGLKIKDIIVRNLKVEESEVTDEASFVKDLGADSLDLVDMIMDIENEFKIAIADEDMENLTTVGSLIQHIAKYSRHKWAFLDSILIDPKSPPSKETGG
jgi:acyl carrier protein